MNRLSRDALSELRSLGVKPELAYIDGAHDYESVRADIRGCVALNERMILLGDDYRKPEYDGLRRAVDLAARESGRVAKCLHGYLWGLL
jgi:hypothetical protein